MKGVDKHQHSKQWEEGFCNSCFLVCSFSCHGSPLAMRGGYFSPLCLWFASLWPCFSMARDSASSDLSWAIENASLVLVLLIPTLWFIIWNIGRVMGQNLKITNLSYCPGGHIVIVWSISMLTCPLLATSVAQPMPMRVILGVASHLQDYQHWEISHMSEMRYGLIKSCNVYKW